MTIPRPYGSQDFTYYDTLAITPDTQRAVFFASFVGEKGFEETNNHTQGVLSITRDFFVRGIRGGVLHGVGLHWLRGWRATLLIAAKPYIEDDAFLMLTGGADPYTVRCVSRGMNTAVILERAGGSGPAIPVKVCVSLIGHVYG